MVDSPGPTILIADDEPAVLRLMAAVLQSKGYRVLAAENGEAALELFETREKEVDLLLTDIRMEPSINGDELARRIRRRKPDIKVLYVSGHTPSQEAVVREVQSSQALFLSKPFTPSLLGKKVEEALSLG